MPCAILSVGTELTRGDLVNSNATWLSSALTDLGFDVVEHVTVPDDPKRIVAALGRLAPTVRVIVCTGGLGPTTDDLTAEAVATALGTRLVRHEQSLERIRRRFERAGREMSASNAKQADLPEGAEAIDNDAGTAPGFSVRIGSALAFFLPGVPAEMKTMFDERVAPKIRPLAEVDADAVRLHVYGLPESEIGDRLQGIEADFEGLTIAYRAHFPEVEVKLIARGRSLPDARQVATRAAELARERLEPHVFGEGDDTFAGVVGRRLRGKGWTLAVAESCTGGLLAHLLTREPGASNFLLADVVTYANSAKTGLLGVDEDILRAHGAVSAEVAAEMAKGARRVAGADVSISLTGIAGPSGGTSEKPVGLVFIAVQSPKGIQVVEKHFPGDRHRIQARAAYEALSMLGELCH